MKKNLLILGMVIGGMLLSSCDTRTVKDSFTLASPTGTPSLGLANYIVDHKEDTHIISGATIASEFTSGINDCIVAPTNVGIKMYNVTQKYVLYKTIVWGNLYILTRSNAQNIKELEGKTINYFGGENATPFVITSAILEANNVSCELVSGGSDVSSLNPLFLTNKMETIITAEPSLSNIKSKIKGDYNIIDLQKEFKKMTGHSSYPQASIFIKKELLETNSIDSFKPLLDSVKETKLIEETAKNAISIHESFKTIGEENLKLAIPNCNFEIKENLEDEMTAINDYLDILSKAGLAATFGNKKIDEEIFAK